MADQKELSVEVQEKDSHGSSGEVLGQQEPEDSSAVNHCDGKVEKNDDSTEIVQSNGQDENQATPDDNDKENALPNDYQQSQLNQTDTVVRRFKFPHEFKGRPQSQPEIHFEPSKPLQLPEIGKSSKRLKKEVQVEQKEESVVSETNQEELISDYKEVESDRKSVALDKILTPSTEIDSATLKRRNPRQMFTDSAFYSPKFHPSVADQVEMAYKISASLYDDGNKLSKGQEMYLKRMKKPGDEDFDDEGLPRHDKAPNLKLVMNPEGKVHDWTDLPEEEYPESAPVSAGGPTPEIAQKFIENLQTCQGKGGELFAKRRKKADKWVVDESSVGSVAPSEFADQFVQQQLMQQQQFILQQQEEKQRKHEKVEREKELLRLEREKFQEEQQMIFQQQQTIKQQKSMEMRIPQQPVDLPPNFQQHNLKARSFTPSFDTSIHNAQGINVWANKAPKPFGTSGSISVLGNFSNKSSENSSLFVDQVQVQESNQNDRIEVTYEGSNKEASKLNQDVVEYDCSIKYEEKQQSGLNPEPLDATQHTELQTDQHLHQADHFQTTYQEANSSKSVEKIEVERRQINIHEEHQQRLEVGQSQRQYHHQEHRSELHKSELSMQMKSGGLFSSQSEDGPSGYVGSLRPTTTGMIIRSEGSALYTQANSHQESFFPEIELRKTSHVERKDFLQSGLFSSQSNPQLSAFGDGSNEKLSVRTLVDHFSKYRHMDDQNVPDLSSLREEARARQFQFQEKAKPADSNEDQNMEYLKYQELMSKRRNSLKNYLEMESVCETVDGFSHLDDPSALLKVDGSLMNEVGQRRTKESGDQNTSSNLDKWDNHNSIARGWKTVEATYHPVTFRKIYGVGTLPTRSLKTTASAPQLAPTQTDEDPERFD